MLHYLNPIKYVLKKIKLKIVLRKPPGKMRRASFLFPLKPEKCELGSTLEIATIRFLSLGRRLQKNEELKIQYIHFMDEYLKMGLMKRVCEEVYQSKYSFYLPYYSIIEF